MFKNVAGQKLTVYAFDSTTNLPKTGDAANLTAYRDLDDGGVTVLTDTSATEKDATNAKGFYIFDLTQAETNGDKILFTCKSSTADIVVLAMPAVVYTLPATGILAPTTAGRTLDVTAGGNAGIDLDNIALTNGADAFSIKASGTLSGTHSSTMADLGANAPSTDISGMTLYIPVHSMSAIIDSYDTGTGIATFSPATAATLANGNQWYVFATPKASTVSLYPVNVEQWNGTAVPAEHTAGYPIVTVKDGTGTGELDTSSGVVLAKDHTGANLATAAELAKVPKSDSNVTWNSTAAAQIQSEANDALVANHLDHMYATSASVNDAGASTTAFNTTLTEADNFWDDAQLTFTSGALAGQSRLILAYANANGGITFDEPLTSAPANGVTFVIKGVHAHSKSQITSDVWNNGTRSLTALDEDTTTLDLDATIRAAVGLASANLDTQLGDVPTNSELTTALAAADDAVLAAIAALNNLSAAQVNAEVLDVLNVDTFAELAADPGASPTIVKALMLLYMALRNKIDQTATTKEIHNNAGTVLLTKTTSDDGTTYSESKMA